MIRIAICDDSVEDAMYLSKLLNVFARRKKVDINIQTYNGGKSMLFNWERADKQADILYLDILMPQIDGMKVAEQLRSQGFNNEIIFYSRTDSEAIRGYDVNAFHYIVKGSTPTEKAEKIFDKAIQKVALKSQEHISFSCAGENRSIAIRTIKYFTVDGRVITVHYEGDKTFEFYATLGKIDDVLCDKGFVRINRAVLINLDYMDIHTNTEVVMKDGVVYTFGRSFRKAAKEEIAAWIQEV